MATETNRVVHQLVIEARSDGVEKTTADLDKLTAAENRSNAAGDRTVVVQERATRARLSVAGAVERLAKTMDAEYRAVRQMEQAQALLDRAYQQGLAGTTAYDRATAALADRHRRLTSAADEAAASTRRLADAQRVQSAINGATGVRVDFGTEGRAADVAAYGAEMDRLRAKFVPLFAAEKQHHDTLAEINAAARVGAISEAERAEAVARATGAFTAHTAAMRGTSVANDNVAKSSGIASHQLQNLGYQINDVVTSLASGAPAFQVFAQQGGQIAQVLGETGVGAAVRGVGSAVARFLTPAVLTVGALTGAAVLGILSWSRYDDESRKVGVTLQGLGRETGLTREAFERLATSAAAAGNISVRQASDLGTALAATGQIGPANIARLIAVSKDLAATFSTDLDGVKDKLASFGTAEGITRLNAQLQFLDAKTLSFVQSLFRQGKEQEGIAVAIDKLPPALAKAATAQGAVARAWDAIKVAASDADTAMGRFLDRLTKGPAPEDRLKVLQQRVEALKAADAEGLVQPGGTARGYTAPTSPTVASTTAVPLPPSRPAELKEAQSDLQRYMETLAETKRQEIALAAQKELEASLNRKSGELKKITEEAGLGSDNYRKYKDMEIAVNDALKSGNPELMKRVDSIRDLSEVQSVLQHVVQSTTNAEGERMTAAEKAAEQRRIELDGVRAVTVEGRARVAQMQAEHRQRGQLITGEQALADATHAGLMVREQADQRLRDMLRDQALEADDIRERIRLLGEDTEARAVATARRRTENDLIRDGYSLNGDLARSVIAGAEANARLGVSYDRAAEAQQRMRDGQRELASELTTFLDDALLGTGKLEDAFKSLAKTLASNTLKAVVSGEGPLAGILGTASTEKGRLGGILGGQLNLGSLFNSDKITEALGIGAESGLGKAMAAALKEQRAGGGFFSSPLGGTLAGAGAGAALGYSSQSPLVGGLGGALTGFLASGGNPVGALIGGAAGIAGGSLAHRPSRKKDRDRERSQRNREFAACLSAH